MDFTDTQTSTNTLLERVQAAAAAGTLGPALDKVADTTVNPTPPPAGALVDGTVCTLPAPQPAADVRASLTGDALQAACQRIADAQVCRTGIAADGTCETMEEPLPVAVQEAVDAPEKPITCEPEKASAPPVPEDPDALWPRLLRTLASAPAGVMRAFDRGQQDKPLAGAEIQVLFKYLAVELGDDSPEAIVAHVHGLPNDLRRFAIEVIEATRIERINERDAAEDRELKKQIRRETLERTGCVPGEDLDALRREFNGRFFVLRTGATVSVGDLVRSAETGKRELCRMTVPTFCEYHRPLKVMFEDAAVSAAKLWLEWTGRRAYEGLALEPDPSRLPKDHLNLWQGFGVDSKPGQWGRMFEHMSEVLCAGDLEAFNYLLNWCAWAVQHPGELPEVAVVLKGPEGTGKSMFARALLKLFGEHGLQVTTPRHLVGNFNAHRAATCLLFADEAFFAGDPSVEGALKAAITEPTFLLESKGVDAIEVRNRLKVIMSTNSEWAVRASADARRYFILDVSPKRQRDHAYFAALVNELESGGLEAMLYDLLHTDLSGFNVRARPVTAGLQREKANSLQGAHRWLFEVLWAGSYTFCDSIGRTVTRQLEAEAWHSTADLRAALADWQGHQRRFNDSAAVSPQALGRLLTTVARPRRGPKPAQTPGYLIHLGAARANFAKILHSPDLFAETADTQKEEPDLLG